MHLVTTLLITPISLSASCNDSTNYTDKAVGNTENTTNERDDIPHVLSDHDETLTTQVEFNDSLNDNSVANQSIDDDPVNEPINDSHLINPTTLDNSNGIILTNERLSKQLDNIRNLKHSAFIQNKMNYYDGDKNNINVNEKWPKNTLVIASDSMMNNIDEKRLSRNINVTLRCFSGAKVEDMKNYINPLLKKCPDYVIIHVATNNCKLETSDAILVKLLNLKTHILSTLPNCKVIISQPTLRVDDGKASLTVTHLIDKLNLLDIDLIDNSNILREHLGNKGLHLNGRGAGRLAMNIISLIKQL